MYPFTGIVWVMLNWRCSVQISDSDIDHIVTLYHLRRDSRHPADNT